jgi:outer membrane protein OmpA-like peptidoglycan-associated protein
MNMGQILNTIFLPVFLLLTLLGPVTAQERKALPVAGINSEYDELMPVISPDGKTLYFVRTGHPENTGGEKAGQDIWYSQKSPENNEWQKAVNPGAPLNNIYNNAISSLSPDGRGALLNNKYLARNRMLPGLSYAVRTGAGWSKPEVVNIQDFAPETGSLSFYQASDSILFLSMQTDTTYAEDIFISRRAGEKEWLAPERISKNINTTGFEIAPFLAPDQRTLYFTSNGHGGLGHADIFRSRRLDNTWLNWSEPVNLGAKVNTTGFDGYFILDGSSGDVYFTRENQERGDTDIYFIRIAEIFSDEDTTVEISKAAIPLPSTNPPEGSNLTQPVLPASVLFEINSAALNPAAEAVLQSIWQQLKPSENFLVISGHADDTGTEAANKTLSEKRARAVATYLQSQGLPAALIKIQVYGSSQPVLPNQSAAGRAKNRRVEIRVE